MYTFEIERLVDAPGDMVWALISNHSGYADVAPNLSKVELLSGDGLGAQRRCYDTRGRGWNEQCVLWQDGQRYSFEVETNDYPYPFVKMQGTWGLEQRPDGVVVKMHFDYVPKYDPPFLGWLFDRLAIKRTFRRICDELMDNWVREIEHRVQQRKTA